MKSLLTGVEKGLNMEIKFEQDELKFNVRSSCIIKDKEHKQVLLYDMRGVKTHQAYILPGGRLDVLENSKEAVIREIQEELGVDINPVLVSVEEIIENQDERERQKQKHKKQTRT